MTCIDPRRSSGNSTKQQQDAGELNEAQKMLGESFIAGHNSSEILKPSYGSLHFPPFAVSPQGSSILGFAAVAPIRRNHLYTALRQLAV